MTRTFLILVLILAAINLSAQEEEIFTIKGKLLDVETKNPVPRVTILLVNKQTGTSSMENGSFALPVNIGDEIKFSSIGYESISILVTKELKASAEKEDLVLFMIPAIYELDSVVVFHLGEDFYLRRKKGKPMEVIGIPKPTDNPRDWTETQVIADYGGVGIFGLLNAFDKKLQQQKQIKRLQADLDFRKKRDAEIQKIYNKEVVKRVTGIDDRVIEEFMEFCDFREGILLRSSEYELTVLILKKYQEFLRR